MIVGFLYLDPQAIRALKDTRSFSLPLILRDGTRGLEWCFQGHKTNEIATQELKFWFLALD